MAIGWEIKYWPENNVLQRWFRKLPKEQFQSVSKELAILQRCGNQLQLPHSKGLGKGLFELRERRFGCRVYYTFSGNQIIVLLAAGDKSTQKKDIKVARERLKRLQKDGVTL